MLKARMAQLIADNGVYETVRALAEAVEGLDDADVYGEVSAALNEAQDRAEAAEGDSEK